MKPSTQYTKSGRINIAYQVFGTGQIDLVYIPGWVSNIDWMWACPELVYFLEELGKIARVILFDKRGTGLSDRVVELSTIEERMDDIRAVMDAVGSEKAILFGHSEGGSVSALFAATYPNRVVSLITFGIFAKRRYSVDYPWAPTDEERQVVYDMIENSWGGGEMNLESLAPSKAQDKKFMDWLASYFRSGASPSAALVLTKMNTQVDIIDILGSIKVPTLILQRTNDIDVKIEEGKFIAERIKGAKFVELEGNDHIFWIGRSDEVLAEMKEFIVHVKPIKNYEIRLFTFVAAQISTKNNEHSTHKKIIGQLVAQYRGNIIQYKHDRFVAIFEGPNKAAHCSLELINAMLSVDTQLAIGIQIKEAVIEEVHTISQEIEAFIDTILENVEQNQVLTTQTVKNLLSGAGLYFKPFKKTLKHDFNEVITLFNVTDHLESDSRSISYDSKKTPKNGSFLENVLQSIDIHLKDESFGVDMLCKEIGISERQMQRKLKAITNKSPNQLITSVRLHRAKELMLNHQLTIAEISFQTGFSSPSYFAKCFKKEFGVSPSILQNKIQDLSEY